MSTLTALSLGFLAGSVYATLVGLFLMSRYR